MNGRVPVAAAIGVGYVLGRTHKLRWAMIIGAVAASGRMGGISSQVLERGTQVMRASPELAKLAESATRLVDAGRSAATAAMSSRAESLTSALEGRADQLETARDAGGAATGTARRVVSGKRPTDEAERAEEEEPEDEYDEEEEEEPEDEYDEEEEEEEEEPEGEEEEPEGGYDEGRAEQRRRPVVRRGGR